MFNDRNTNENIEPYFEALTFLYIYILYNVTHIKFYKNLFLHLKYNWYILRRKYILITGSVQICTSVISFFSSKEPVSIGLKSNDSVDSYQIKILFEMTIISKPDTWIFQISQILYKYTELILAHYKFHPVMKTKFANI